LSNNSTKQSGSFSTSFHVKARKVFSLASQPRTSLTFLSSLSLPFFKVTRPYLIFILSLVISDAFASFLLGFQLTTGSYLPVVHGIQVSERGNEEGSQ